MDDSREFRRGATAETGQLLRFPKSTAQDPADPATCPTESDLFAALWQALAEILGTAAAATLLGRAAQRAAPRWPELTALSIKREALDYEFTVPPGWKERTGEPPRALHELVRELWTLLVDLTGPVVVNRLAQIPELRDGRILPDEQEPS